MAKTLTTSYQLISSKTWSFTYSSKTYNVGLNTYAKMDSQNIENLQTNYTVQSRYNLITTNATVNIQNATSKLDGKTKTYSTASFSSGSSAKETVLQTVTGTINHNTDGSSQTKSIVSSWTASFGGSSGNVTGDIKGPKIDRYPMLTNADNFNDTENPKITYTTVLAFEGATVDACISVDGTNPLVPYRDVNVNTGQYTFVLSNEERALLQNATTTSNTRKVTFILRTTTTNNTVYTSKIERDLTIINNLPGYTFTKAETYPPLVNLIGASANTVVKNASIVNFAVTPITKKGATTTSVSLTNGSATVTDTTSPYDDLTVTVTNSDFLINVKDSRGNEVPIADRTNTITMIDYQKVDIKDFSFERDGNTSNDIILNVEATFYQVAFGATMNTPFISWKLGDNGTENVVPSSNYIIDTENHTVRVVNYTMTNALSYLQDGTFILIVTDSLSSDTDSQTVIKGIPVVELGEHDVQVNGDLIVAETDRTNPINVLTSLTNLSTEISNIIDSGYIDTGNTGYYIKFADGTMITRHTKTGTASISTSWGNGYTTGATNTIDLGNFPVAFLSGSTPYIWVTIVRDDNNYWMASTGGTSETSAGKTSLLRFTSATVKYRFRVLAIGRWK